jgi:GAG-pre-integrase domain
MQLKHTDIDGTVCNTYSDKRILPWMNNKYQRTIPLNQSNVSVIRSEQSYKGFLAYFASQKDSTKVCLDKNKLTVYAGQQTTNNVPLDESEDSKVQSQAPNDELMLWNYRLAHSPFKKLQHMADIGDIPKRLTQKIPQKCHVCMFGKGTRVPWRYKGKEGKGKMRRATYPGKIVSIRITSFLLSSTNEEVSLQSEVKEL